MGLYHFHVEVLSRSTGRSATGAAAYQAAERLEAVAYVAYQSGEKLHGVGDKIIHDYTRKKGVVHKEIILPKDAPPEFKDRETLWNAVEKRERRDDSRLLREIDAALQTEFTLQENIALLREFVRENFVDKGMIADLAIHDKGDGNPHVHIKLTLRDVTPEGFGNVNRDWNKTAELVGWRKNWAGVNNRKFEEKGLETRIDHRSYRARGVDREPSIHLGAEAWALERRGVRTEKGDYNREVKRRNEEREAAKMAELQENDVALRQEPPTSKETADEKSAAKTAHNPHLLSPDVLEALHKQLKDEKTEQHKAEFRELVKEAKIEKELQQMRQPQKTPRHIELPETDPDKPYIPELEEQLKAEKAMQFVENMRERQEIAAHLTELKENYFALEKDLYALKNQRNEAEQDLPQLRYRAEQVDEYAENIEVLQGRAAKLREFRQNLRSWDIGKKREADKKILQAEREITQAQEFFKNRFNVDPDQAPAEINRVQKLIRDKKDIVAIKAAQIQGITEKQTALELEYQTKKLLAQTRFDNQQIEKLLEKMTQTPETTRERLLHEKIECQLNTITDENFQKIIEKLPEHQAKILTNIRDTAKAKDQEMSKSVEQTRTQSHEHER